VAAANQDPTIQGELDAVLRLAGQEGRQLLAAVMASEAVARSRAAAGDASAVDPIRAATAARSAHPGTEPQLIGAALTQVRLRGKARSRLGEWADRLLLTSDGSEQATRLVVARRHAAAFVAAGSQTILDVGCGIGLDSLAFAEAGLRVVAIEQDPVTAAVAIANATELGLDLEVRIGDALILAPDLLRAADAVYVDPARRTTGPGSRRIQDPQQWSPSWAWVVQLSEQCGRLGAKVAPGVDHTLIPAGGAGTWTSVDGDLVEAFISWPVLSTTSGRIAQVIRGERTTTLTEADLPVTIPLLEPEGVAGAWLLEPDDAVIRSGLVAAVVARTQGALLDPVVAYVVSTQPAAPALAGDLAVAYDIQVAMPFHLGRLRDRLRALGVGRVTVKKRAFAGDVDDIRRQLRLDRAAPGVATVIITRVGLTPWCFLSVS
jgi:hypothetical protein